MLKSRLFVAILSIGIGAFTAGAFAKLPPAPPADPAAVAAKAEKDKAAAEKTKADQARYEDKAVANFQGNLKKAGKPIPKPTPIVAPAPAVAATPAVAAPAVAPAKPAAPAKKT
jgi:hypothetical protein